MSDALWALQTAYKSLIGMSPYKIIFGKLCYLPFELEYKVCWALKQLNFGLDVLGEHIKLHLQELEELCGYAYDLAKDYKVETMKAHDRIILHRDFKHGHKV